MNNSELIKYCEGRIAYLESFVEAYTGIINPLRYEEKTKAYKDIIRELSRTRIRVTAEEKPKKEDATFDGYEWYVMAQDVLYNCWGETPFEYVAKNEKEYPHWTCAPQLPEVTP